MKKSMRTALAAILALVMLVAVIPMTAVAAYKTPFDDVKADDYFYEAVIWAYTEGVTTGTSATKFAPEKTCTRGQVVTFLWRAMGKPEPASTENPFEDVKASDYYFKPILWAVEKGITTGTSAKRFSPDTTCTNAHILTFIWRALGEPGKTGEGEWYADAEKWANGAALLDGTYTGEYDVNAGCPRANVVTYLYRYMTDGKLTLYVSAGADANGADGSIEKPFATIEAARDYIRTLDKSKYKGIDVRIAKGGYLVTKPVEFTVSDSGTNDCPISYIGENGASIIGGAVLSASDFTKAEGGLTEYFPEEARDKIVMIDLKKYGISADIIADGFERHNYHTVVPFLSVNGERQTLAQFPDDWMHIDEAVIHSPDGTFATAVDLVTLETVTYDAQYAAEVQSWSEVVPVFIRGRFVKLWCPDDSRVVSIDKSSNKFDMLFGGGYGYEKGTIMYFYNVPEELDKPGEYIIDKNAVLYYYPTDEFADARLTVPLSEGLLNVKKANYLTFKNIEFTSCRKDGLNINADNFTLDGCTVSSIVGTGIIIKGQANTIKNNSIYNIGAFGIRAESGDVATATGKGLLITENDFYEISETDAYGYAVEAKGVNITISHNDCHDSNYKAFSFSNSVNCTIEYNDVWNMLLLCDDVGAISTDGYMNSNIVVRYNYIHDIGPVGEAAKIKDYNPDYEYYGANALYFDNGASYIETYGNVVCGCDTGYLSNGGRYNSCHNNIFMDCRMWYVTFSEWMYATNRDEEGNIHGSVYFDEYVYSPVWKEMNPDLCKIVTNAEGHDKTDKMLWNAPTGDTCYDNFIAYNKADRVFTTWGIKPYYFEPDVEVFSGEGLKYSQKPDVQYSMRQPVTIEEVIEKAVGIADMTPERFATIGRTAD